jgi:hypothetical protein
MHQPDHRPLEADGRAGRPARASPRSRKRPPPDARRALRYTNSPGATASAYPPFAARHELPRFCVRPRQATAHRAKYYRAPGHHANKSKTCRRRVFTSRLSRALRIDFTEFSRMPLMRLSRDCMATPTTQDVDHGEAHRRDAAPCSKLGGTLR